MRINAYAIEENAGDIAAKFEALSNKLRDEGWSRVVHVRDEGETVNVFLLSKDNVLQGITALIAESDEAIFVNIVGDVNPALLGVLGDNFLDGSVDLGGLGDSLSGHSDDEAEVESESEEG